MSSEGVVSGGFRAKGKQERKPSRQRISMEPSNVISGMKCEASQTFHVLIIRTGVISDRVSNFARLNCIRVIGF